MMLSEEQRLRYARHITLAEIGERGQKALLNARIFVVGAGGLGSPVLLYLAAAGVKHITLIDDDQIDLSNLQRQVLFTPNDIGKYKVDVAAQRIRELNPDVTTLVIKERLTAANACGFIRESNLVIDGSDNFNTRYVVNDACVKEEKPWVFGSIFRHEGQVTVFNYHNGPTYRCLFPEPPDNIPSCSEAGVLGSLTGIIGSAMATEAIKIITGAGMVASGKLMIFNMLDLEIRSLEFERTAEAEKINLGKKQEVHCVAPFLEIDPNRFNELISSDVLAIDVREDHESLTGIEGAVKIPLSLLESSLDDFKHRKEIIVFCESGIRSRYAGTIINRSHPAIRVYNLTGGMLKYRAYFNAEDPA